MDKSFSKHPSWIRGKISWDDNFNASKDLLRSLDLNSVCVEAACPNKGECWERKHITFLILGDKCTRGCLFCNLPKGVMIDPDEKEPSNIVEAVKTLGSRYVVITSVTRDDLLDGGAEQFVKTVNAIKEEDKSIKVELLIPDFNGKKELIEKVAFSGADVIGHNIEMAESLYKKIRPLSNYRTSLNVLKMLSELSPNGKFLTKSSIILGLGERTEEILQTLQDLHKVRTDIVYMGQYLNPTNKHAEVKKYYTPDEFSFFKQEAEKEGFLAVCSDPMVRSSYRAYESFVTARKNK